MIVDEDYAELSIRLSESYQESGRLDLAVLQIEQAKEIYKSLDDQYHYAVCLLRLAELQKQNGHITQAFEYLHKAESILLKLYLNSPENKLYKSDYAVAIGNLGSYCQITGKYIKALEYMQQAQMLLKEIVEKNSEDYVSKLDLAISYSQTGHIFHAQGDYPATLKHFEKSYSIREELHEQFPEKQTYMSELADSCARMGELYLSSTLYENSLHYFQKQSELLSKLVSINDKNTNYRIALANSYVNLGEYFEHRSDFEKSRRFYFQAYQVLDKIDHDNSTAVNTFELCKVFQRLGDSYQLEDNLKEALKIYEKSNEYAAGLLNNEASNEEYGLALAIIKLKLGEVADKTGEITKSIQYLLSSKELLNKVFNQNKSNIQTAKNIVDTYNKLVVLFHSIFDIERTIATANEFETVSSAIKDKYPEIKADDNLAFFYLQIGDLYFYYGKFKKAVEWFTKAYLGNKGLIKNGNNTMLAKENHAISSAWLGEAYNYSLNFCKSQTFYKNAKELYYALSNSDNEFLPNFRYYKRKINRAYIIINIPIIVISSFFRIILGRFRYLKQNNKNYVKPNY